jgi:hypothetical protein
MGDSTTLNPTFSSSQTIPMASPVHRDDRSNRIRFGEKKSGLLSYLMSIPTIPFDLLIIYCIRFGEGGNHEITSWFIGCSCVYSLPL